MADGNLDGGFFVIFTDQGPLTPEGYAAAREFALKRSGEIDTTIARFSDRTKQYYTGLCTDIDVRLDAHNAGQSPHTSKFKPWRLISAHYFIDVKVAADFERYLKSGSGRAFAAKHLRETAST